FTVTLVLHKAQPKRLIFPPVIDSRLISREHRNEGIDDPVCLSTGSNTLRLVGPDANSRKIVGPAYARHVGADRIELQFSGAVRVHLVGDAVFLNHLLERLSLTGCTLKINDSMCASKTLIVMDNGFNKRCSYPRRYASDQQKPEFLPAPTQY